MFAFLALLLFLSPLPVQDSLATDTALSLLQGAVAQYVQPFDAEWTASEMRVAWADLDGNGQSDALVYLDGAAWCGSSGCTLLVFAAVDSVDVAELGAYTPVAEISLMHGPVRVAAEQTHGWHDLIVQDPTGALRRLAFDGETYPFSPSEGGAVTTSPESVATLFADA